MNSKQLIESITKPLVSIIIRILVEHNSHALAISLHHNLVGQNFVDFAVFHLTLHCSCSILVFDKVQKVPTKCFDPACSATWVICFEERDKQTEE